MTRVRTVLALALAATLFPVAQPAWSFGGGPGGGGHQGGGGHAGGGFGGAGMGGFGGSHGQGHLRFNGGRGRRIGGFDGGAFYGGRHGGSGFGQNGDGLSDYAPYGRPVYGCDPTTPSRAHPGC